ncbi:MAG TPA: hypothetical protein VJH03_02290 [Blastocatellia bacterium]|nr:hypothetical protein [Blastocatellia bacterium]
MQSRKHIALLVVTLLVFASAASAATLADEKSGSISGKYEGVAKNASIGELPLTVEIKNDNGKISGKIDSPQGPAPITSGTYADGKLTLKFDAGGTEGTVTAKFADGKITGEWELGGQTGTLELKQVGAAATAGGDTMKKEVTPAPAANPAMDPVSGEWDAVADAAGQAFPFTLKLKVEGQNVTGESSSAMGTAPLSKGTLAGDKLSFTLETPNGAVVFTAMVKEGKLTGDFDFAGQMQGKWEAKKK